MKKSIFLLWLLTVTICLTACWNKKDFNMSFEDALELASHSSIQDVMANAENTEQSINVAWSYDKDDTRVDVKLNSKSKQNLKDIQSESNISVDLKIQEKENNLDLKWDLDIKFIPSTIYLSLNSLDVKWDESTEWVAQFASWFLNQWFSIPLGETIDLNSFNMKDQFELSSKIKDVINNEWFQVYNGKFKDYNWYNARKISIDDEKLIKILKDYYNTTDIAVDDTENETISTNEEPKNTDNSEETSVENTENNAEDSTENSTEISTEFSTENNEETIINDENSDNEISPENIDSEINNVKIENFEWYLVIIWEDKVALAIDNMDITDNGTTTNLNGLFSDKDNSLNVFSEWEEVITLTAKRKWSHFNVNLNLSGLCLVEWTITPKISSSKIDIDFNLSITIKSDDDSTIIPLKGSRSYAPISEYTVEIPSDSQDLTQMLWGMFWWLYGLWWDDAYYDDYYGDYDLDSEALYNEELMDNTEEEIANEETVENTEETNIE